MKEHAKISKVAFWLFIAYFIVGGVLFFTLLNFEFIPSHLIIFLPFVTAIVSGVIFILAIVGLFEKGRRKLFSYITVAILVLTWGVVPLLMVNNFNASSSKQLKPDEVNKKIDLCNRGDKYACYKVASAYEKGNGVGKNIEKSISYYIKAFENKHLKAGFDLGAIYGHGKLVAQDHNKSVYYYSKSCSQGYADSCFNLGNSYARGGRGVEKDLKKAKALFLKACFGEDFKACSNYLYFNKSYHKRVSIDPSAEGTWEDDSNNWIRTFGTLQPSSIEVIHSKYWRSAHWTKEFEYFFELKFSKEELDSFLAELKEDSEKSVTSFTGKPEWFLKGEGSDYRAFSLGGSYVRIFVNTKTGHLFIWDSQV